MELDYFKMHEFRGQEDILFPQLLIRLDVFRHILGYPVDISPASGSIGRTTGTSWHNYILHGLVYAIDVMPRNLLTKKDAEHAIQSAKYAGFKGIGIYPHWKLNTETRPGMHLDLRTTHPAQSPAIWGGIRPNKTQIIVSMETALKQLPQ